MCVCGVSVVFMWCFVCVVAMLLRWRWGVFRLGGEVPADGECSVSAH